MKKHFYILFLSIISLTIYAQEWNWYNPMDAGFPVVQNQGFQKEISQTYTRLPDRAKAVVREPVWNLSRNSAGLAIHFYCNAPQIHIRYAVSGSLNMPHMPTTGVSGIDMYSIDSDGKTSFCFGNYSFGDTIHYYYSNLGKDKYHDRGFEYRVYLPLYNSVDWMEIGIPAETNGQSPQLSFLPSSTEKPIVLYGTSIAQGACASRPAMAWGNIVQRELGYPLINLGFSGNGQLEKEVLDFVNEPDARLFILDCLPNLTNKSEAEVTDLVLSAVRQLRSKHTAPILLVEHAGYSNAPTDNEQYACYTRLNKGSRKGYEQLQAEGIKELYYLSHEELALCPDAWVDYVHPSDLGMQQQATAIIRKVRGILHIPVGNIPTTQPLMQRREPNNYEWQARHRAFLEEVRNHPPKAVILGNSITHFWGGEPVASHKNGAKSWEQVMRPAGFQNLGCGWDRIENVLWRVYHGELDGYQTSKVVVMIGTNNKDFSSDEDIVAGLRFLLSAIRERQPKAEIKVVGILPRRNGEEWVKNINQRIRTMAEKEGYRFSDAGTPLLLKEGKIDESLFIGDGLHPNEKGYQSIAKIIAE